MKSPYTRLATPVGAYHSLTSRIVWGDEFATQVEGLAARINADVTSLIKARGCATERSALQAKIVEAFFMAAAMGGSVLEAVKHHVAREQSDFIDMRDLVEALSPKRQQSLLGLFQLHRPLNPQYLTIVISDLDCTAIERAAISTPVYYDGCVVPGFAPLVNALTHQGITTMTFISARPKFMENWSIKKTASAIRSVGLTAFSFEAGQLPGSAIFVAAQAADGASTKKLARRLLVASAKKFAKLKMDSYLKLQTIFPHARFVFFGDDAQGDYLFAQALVRHNEQNFAFIRDVAAPEMKVAALSDEPRILYHRSYYEAAVKAPLDVLPPSQRDLAFVLMQQEHLSRYSKELGLCNPQARERDQPWLTNIMEAHVPVPEHNFAPIIGRELLAANFELEPDLR